MLDHVPEPANSPSYAYRCERSTYASEDRDEPDCFARYSATTPELAIQRLRDEARILLAGLPEAERPVLGWAEGVGCVRALGALHGGRTCGFSLRHGDGWSEWVVRPVSRGSADPAGATAVSFTEAVPCGVCALCAQGA
ncbi:hypothetical protein ACTFBT_21450 [Streptomyces microflavus]|uniref:Uncharacterized protein n=1 Tax=Streptomyces microflavus TaxID=1919 RepID=A0A7J0CUW6_STRMI|nr:MULTISPECIES: hypothetical protein [Streptomyces]MDX2980916.1 hypothetical protein [Streptomyces sp. NRRL_B-2249]GFN05744.1 hypothetical protein Smic_43000 [Streptomyces microflavus]GGX72800.1 hypothetical protein GCM10010298_41780 [Streptomyces microflavus]